MDLTSYRSTFYHLLKVLTTSRLRMQECERILKSDVHVDVKDEFGNTPLIVSCQNGKKRLAKLFLRYKANINEVNGQVRVPCMYINANASRHTNICAHMCMCVNTYKSIFIHMNVCKRTCMDLLLRHFLLPTPPFSKAMIACHVMQFICFTDWIEFFPKRLHVKRYVCVGLP
jgi:ankyrin repeat protein